MKRILTRIGALTLTMLIASAAMLTAFAASSAKTGDSVSVSVNVTGVDNMGSLTVELHYDKEKFDFLSEETLTGMGVANTTVDGQIIWGALFEPENGSDFSNKTDVFNAILIAKKDIDDLDSEFTFKVRDAYNIKYERVEDSYISYSVALGEPENTSKPNSDTNSKLVVSDYEGNGQNPSNSSAVVSSTTQSENDSSKVTESKAADSESKAVASDKEEDTASEASSALWSESGYDESEFDEVPPIKLDTIDTASSSENKGHKFPTAAIIAVAVCLVVACAGIIILVVKKK